MKLSLACLALVLLGTSASVQNLPDLPSHVIAAAEQARATLRQPLEDGRTLLGSLALVPGERQVRIDWSRAGRTRRPPEALGSTTLGTRFHPTACASLDPRSAVIAGRDRWGNAVLERWEFSDPLQGKGGSIVLPHVQRIDELYSGNPPGESIIRGLWNSPLGDSPGVMLFFHGARTVYRFDLVTEEFAALAALEGDGAEGLLEVTALAENWQGTGAVLDLPGGGVLYRFEREPEPAEATDDENAVLPRDRLYLIDLDGDGWVDAARHWNRDDPRHVSYVTGAVLRP